MAEDVEIPVVVSEEFIRIELGRMIDAGEIRIELCGHVECAGYIKGFTLNKRKYRMRFEDENEDSVRVIIEPKG